MSKTRPISCREKGEECIFKRDVVLKTSPLISNWKKCVYSRKLKPVLCLQADYRGEMFLSIQRFNVIQIVKIHVIVSEIELIRSGGL